MLYASVRQRKLYVKPPQQVAKDGVDVDYLTLEMDDEWALMDTIVLVFQNGSVEKQMLHTFGKPTMVPWECLQETGMLTLGVTGYQGETTVMTTARMDNTWVVVQNSPITGDDVLDPTPTLMQQFSEAAARANAAAAAADEARQALLQAAQNGEFNGRDGVTGSAGYTPVKGTDYWTEADRREIVDAVLTAMPAAEGAMF